MSFPARLIDGYRSFLTGRLPEEQSRYRELAEQGQSPQIMVIGCSDSRVSPEVIFDARPGELFVVPRGVEHQPFAEEETHLLLIEPTGTPNTGDERTAAPRRAI